MKSGWCLTALPKDVPKNQKAEAEKQHGACKRVFKVQGYAEFSCECPCHPKVTKSEE